MSILKDPLLQQQAEHIEVGRKGEVWVAAREQQKLAQTPFSDFVKISSIAQSASFDIESRTISGAPLYIEVKSTTRDAALPFYMTENEFAFAAHCASHNIPYELHRVHHVDDDQLRGEIVYSAKDVLNLFDKTPITYVLKPKPSVQEETPLPDYLPWEDCAVRIPGTRCKFYLSKIEGPHPEYRFDRRFLHGTYEYQVDKIWLCCDIESTGVYEVTMIWTDEDGTVLQRQREWFLLVDGKAYDLEVGDVLNAVNSLKEKAS